MFSQGKKKEKINKFDYLTNVKFLCLKKIKRQTTKYENIFTKYISGHWSCYKKSS